MSQAATAATADIPSKTEKAKNLLHMLSHQYDKEILCDLRLIRRVWERRRNYATDQGFWTLSILGR